MSEWELGVMRQRSLFPQIREHVQRLLNGYVEAPAILDEIDQFIVPPALGDQAGVLGAFALAERVLLDAGASRSP